MKVDLHSHTKYSDGKLTPEELVLRAAQMQVDLLAITDHDCIDALAPAQQAIDVHKLRVKLVNGIEISTRWHGREIHILGLNIDCENEKLLSLIRQQTATRISRAEKIMQKLSFLGIENLSDKVRAKTTGIVSRVHIAQVLMEEGICSTLQQAFDKYIGEGKRAYVLSDWVSIEQAVEVIHSANGSAVLAHPYHYGLKGKWLRRLFDSFVAAGGDASEVTHPNVSPSKAELVKSLVVEHNLAASIGSDFHAPTRWNELGRKLALPDDLRCIWKSWQPTSIN